MRGALLAAAVLGAAPANAGCALDDRCPAGDAASLLQLKQQKPQLDDGITRWWSGDPTADSGRDKAAAILLVVTAVLCGRVTCDLACPRRRDEPEWTLAEITDGAAAPAAALAARAVVALASDGFISSLPALTSDELAAALGAGQAGVVALRASFSVGAAATAVLLAPRVRSWPAGALLDSALSAWAFCALLLTLYALIADPPLVAQGRWSSTLVVFAFPAPVRFRALVAVKALLGAASAAAWFPLTLLAAAAARTRAVQIATLFVMARVIGIVTGPMVSAYVCEWVPPTATANELAFAPAAAGAVVFVLLHLGSRTLPPLGRAPGSTPWPRGAWEGSDRRTLWTTCAAFAFARAFMAAGVDAGSAFVLEHESHLEPHHAKEVSAATLQAALPVLLASFWFARGGSVSVDLVILLVALLVQTCATLLLFRSVPLYFLVHAPTASLVLVTEVVVSGASRLGQAIFVGFGILCSDPKSSFYNTANLLAAGTLGELSSHVVAAPLVRTVTARFGRDAFATTLFIYSATMLIMGLRIPVPKK